MKLSPIDLGPLAVDLAAMEGSNMGELESSHRVVSGCAAAEIEGAEQSRWKRNQRSLCVAG
jgi:hypothetical protein